ncbi:hypothetical protein ElyMa_002327000 [Elysia marginata]|uniref:IMS import disulfide relay-system CHCH-CHCH-like Cx9C domain-containing protein n=1 Tax=Elysia marginata TaxID=1093978 RepID=A0AAV4G5B0_9GAST|nr:hypothetical protein ElyMa_002327000 [Elysia marginata]
MRHKEKIRRTRRIDRGAQAALKCFQEEFPKCKLEKIVSAYRRNFKTLEGNVEKCVAQLNKDSNTSTAITSADQNKDAVAGAWYSPQRDEHEDCEQRFEACVTQEFLHASEHKNYTRLCNEVPFVFSCMERVLENECHHVPDKIQQNLRNSIDRLRRSVSPECEYVRSRAFRA